jgi:hypothetical protein
MSTASSVAIDSWLGAVLDATPPAPERTSTGAKR